jgi:hypothetical protein
LGIDGIQLAQEVGRAGGDFVFFGEAVLRRAALDDVADVNVFALQAHGFNHLGEEFSGPADKREALGVFIGTGTFADKN